MDEPHNGGQLYGPFSVSLVGMAGPLRLDNSPRLGEANLTGMAGWPDVIALDSAAAARTPDRQRVARQLPADPHAGRTARRVVDEVCTRWELDSLRDAAQMIVTELATNAVEYAGSPIELCITVRRSVLRIEVSDSCFVLPVLLEPSPDAVRGHGLRLVDSLASRWGATPSRWGKTVWVDLVIASSPHSCGSLN